MSHPCQKNKLSTPAACLLPAGTESSRKLWREQRASTTHNRFRRPRPLSRGRTLGQRMKEPPRYAPCLSAALQPRMQTGSRLDCCCGCDTTAVSSCIYLCVPSGSPYARTPLNRNPEQKPSSSGVSSCFPRHGTIAYVHSNHEGLRYRCNGYTLDKVTSMGSCASIA